jgi:hypothetical protein
MKSKFLITGLLAGVAVVSMLTSCKDDDDTTPDAFTATTPFAAVGTVAGQQINTTNGSVIIGWDSLIVPLIDGGSINFVSKVKPGPSVDLPSVQVTLGNLRYSDNSFDDQAKFYDYFRTGASQFTYGVDITDGSTNRNVDVSYVDASGVTWASNLGSALQPGSVFQITDTVHMYKPTGSVLKYKAAFLCKLYDGNGNVIDANITNFIGQVETYE